MTIEIFKLNNNLYTIREYKEDTFVRLIISDGTLLPVLCITDLSVTLFSRPPYPYPYPICTIENYLHYSSESISGLDLLPLDLYNRVLIRALSI